MEFTILKSETIHPCYCPKCMKGQWYRTTNEPKGSCPHCGNPDYHSTKEFERKQMETKERKKLPLIYNNQSFELKLDSNKIDIDIAMADFKHGLISGNELLKKLKELI